MNFINVTINGLLTGVIYSQMALGLSLIYGVMRLVNFAHGEMLTFGMLLICVLQNFIQHPLLLLISIIFVYCLLFFALYKIIFKRILGKDETTQFIAMAALSMVILNANLFIFHADTYSYTSQHNLGSYEFGTLIIQEAKIISSLLSFISMTLLFVFLRYNLIGQGIRAVSLNPRGALLMGLPVKKLFTICILIASFLMGISSFSLILNMDVSVQTAPELTLLCFVIVILGGLGSITGTVLSSMLIGLVESYVVFYGSSIYKSVISFVLLVVVLLIRPQGILGKKI